MNQFDVSWDWRTWLQDSAGNPDLELYALITANSWPSAAISRVFGRPPSELRVEGLCCIRGGLVADLGAGSPLTYLELLAVAPWNRHEYKPKAELRCGIAMMVHVVQRSIANGFEGRVGLHSLEDPHTHKFYRRCGMTECGRDPTVDNELYFEFSAEDAAHFLTRTT
jgi:hypothetical protein